MANKYKKHTARPGAAVAASPQYPSKYGSHESMVEEAYSDDLVICRDNRGRYITKKFRLDSGIADPARFANTPYRDKRLDFYLSLASEYLKE